MPSLCQGVPNNILNDELGPFASDTDLGDISLELDVTETITVNASFFNCEDNPVTNGIVYVARSYFKITAKGLRCHSESTTLKTHLYVKSKLGS